MKTILGATLPLIFVVIAFLAGYMLTWLTGSPRLGLIGLFSAMFVFEGWFK